MRPLLFLVSAAILCADGCPVTCDCSDAPRDFPHTDAVYTTVSCTKSSNVTNNLPFTTSKIILRNFSISEISDFIDKLLYETDSLPYLAQLTLAQCTMPELLDLSFSGLDRLRTLELSRNKITHLPDNFNLTSLQSLDLSCNDLQTVEHQPFITLNSLEVLNLSSNNVGNLSSKSFYGLSALQSLDLSKNVLTLLDNNVFSPLKNLQHLNLSNNHLEVLDEACFSSLLRLQQLDVSWNRLAHVAPGSLHLPSLARLLLAGNPALGGSRGPSLLVGSGIRLQTVDASRTGLKHVPTALTHSIRTLRLAGNSIRSVSRGDLDSYPLIQLLDLTSNDLEEVEEDALGRLDLLVILYLIDNKLLCVPHSLPEKLGILHLEHNRIDKITTGDLTGLKVLEVLLLSDNKIKVVQEGAFSQLDSLATLDLSRNPIITLSAGALSGPPRLRVLKLSSLSVKPPAGEVTFPLSATEHLVTMDLSNSPGLARQLLTDTAALAASRELQELNLSDGGLDSVRSDLLHFVAQLRILLLENNPLNCTGLQWLAVWMRKQEVSEYRKVVCKSPPELSGILLVDLQDAEAEPDLIYTTSPKSINYAEIATKSADIVEKNKEFKTNKITEMASTYPTLSETSKQLAITSQPPTVSETDNFSNNKTHQKRPGTRNLFILTKGHSINSQAPRKEKYVDNINELKLSLQTSTPGNATTAVTATVTSPEDSHRNVTTGEMSMFSSTDHRQSLAHPGLLVLAVGVLGAAAALAMLTSRFTRKRICHQRDIEVNSLPNVTDLW